MIHRFYVPKMEFRERRMVLTESAICRQLMQVLRVKSGEKLFFFDNSGMEYEVKVGKIESKSLEIVLLHQLPGTREPDIRVTLYQALLKKDKWEWLLQKVTELGVSEIVPMITEHCISDQISPTKQQRYEKILIEATEQCGGCRIPKLSESRTIIEVFQSLQKSKSPVFLVHPDN